MFELQPGRTPFEAIALFGYLFLAYFLMELAKGEKIKITVKSLPGLEAIKELINRCVELGRPLYFNMGITRLDSVKGPACLATLSILGEVARQSARTGAELITVIGSGSIVAMARSIVRDAYVAENVLEDYKDDNILWLSNNQYANASRSIAIMNERGIGSQIILGSMGANFFLLLENAHRLGAMQLAGTERAVQLPYSVAASDYQLMGTELFGAWAYLSRDPVILGSLFSEDIYKAIMIISLIIGTILVTLGVM